MSMQIVILRRSVGQRDAIDREIERMHAILRPKYDCRVFAEERHNPNVSYIARGEFEELAAVPDLLLVCYPEADWKFGIEAMRRAKGKVVVRCCAGSEAAKQGGGQSLAEAIHKACPGAYWLCDSRTVAEQLPLGPAGRTGVCAMLGQLSRWDGTLPDEDSLGDLIETDRVNILAVGGPGPDGRLHELLDVACTYCDSYSANIAFDIVESIEAETREYREAVQTRIRSYGIEDQVAFVEPDDAAAMMACLLGCDALLYMAPDGESVDALIAAQRAGLPVIALKTDYNVELLGSDQLCLQDDICLLTAAIRQIAGSEAYRRCLRKVGWANYERRFSDAQLQKRFLEAIEEAAAAI